MTLREMTIDDLEQVTAIEKKIFSDPWSKEGFLSFLIKDYAMFLVVEEKGAVLGYCGMLIMQEEGDITNIAVHPGRRKEGIGRFMLEGLLRIAGDYGVNTIHLEVRQGNLPAKRLYDRCGFIQDGLRRNYYSDPTENAVLMTWVRPAPAAANGEGTGTNDVISEP